LTDPLAYLGFFQYMDEFAFLLFYFIFFFSFIYKSGDKLLCQKYMWKDTNFNWINGCAKKKESKNKC